jgi:hypothetical protein
MIRSSLFFIKIRSVIDEIRVADGGKNNGAVSPHSIAHVLIFHHIPSPPPITLFPLHRTGSLLSILR